MNRVAVVDYGVCNIDSVCRALEECGASPFVASDGTELRSADRVVLPGVGAFPDAMRNLRSRGLDDRMRELVLDHGRPLLGICLGMQLLATRGWEMEETPGFGWIPGEVRRLTSEDDRERVPHIGWNEVRPTEGAVLFEGVDPGTDFYFVHSYHVECDDRFAAATTPYCGGFTSAVENDLVFGVQFHLEKSQRHGFRVLSNFLAI